MSEMSEMNRLLYPGTFVVEPQHNEGHPNR